MPRTLFKRKSKRACVIGLDGVPFSLITRLMDSGVMPKTKDIVSRGAIEPMTASLPEVSSVSWSTFMTGKNPGEHGIFGFTDFRDGGYRLRYPSFTDLESPTIWDTLGINGMKSVVINQPSTYPARAIPGVLISGFVALDLDKSVVPASHYAALEKMGYQIDIDTQRCRDNPPKLFSSLGTLLDARRHAADYLWDRERWNLMEVVVTGTDRLHHFMWDAGEDEGHPHHGDFLAYYGRIDDLIHHIFEKFERDGGGGFFILSDHGFCGTKIEANINTVLRREGFLDMQAGGSSLEDALEGTTAFALDPARIYLHRKSRFPKGTVRDEDASPLLQKLEALFSGLSRNGEPVVRRTFRGGEVYSGPCADRGPDLLLVPHHGFDLKGRLGADEVFAERRFQGMHTWDDAFFFSLDAALLEGARGAASAGVVASAGGKSVVDMGGLSSASGESAPDSVLDIQDAPALIMRSLGVAL
jgi:predicted AlkP superfamily phosphohydrolase/phosphomutase